MRAEDEGEYLCKAFNVAGETTTSAFLLHPGLFFCLRSLHLKLCVLGGVAAVSDTAIVVLKRKDKRWSLVLIMVFN